VLESILCALSCLHSYQSTPCAERRCLSFASSANAGIRGQSCGREHCGSEHHARTWRWPVHPPLPSTPRAGIKGVACIRDVGCAHPGFAPYLARICCPKVHQCIRQNGLSGCAHRCPKIQLRASVSEMTLVCIRFQITTMQHLDPNFSFYHHIFTTGDGPDCRHR